MAHEQKIRDGLAEYQVPPEVIDDILNGAEVEQDLDLKPDDIILLIHCTRYCDGTDTSTKKLTFETYRRLRRLLEIEVEEEEKKNGGDRPDWLELFGEVQDVLEDLRPKGPPIATVEANSGYASDTWHSFERPAEL